MNTKTIVLCIVYAAELDNERIMLVSSNKESLSLPQIDISSLNPKKHNLNFQSIIKLIFEKYVNLSFDWTKPKLLNIELTHEEESNTLITGIYYAIYIPSSTLLSNATFIDIKPYVSQYETLRKLICML